MKFGLVNLLLSVSVVYYAVFDWYMLKPVSDGLYMIDVGQGDSYLFKSGEISILIDTGYGPESIYFLRKILKNDLSINTVILTHSDMDHVGGIRDVLNYYRVDCLIVNTETYDYLASLPIVRYDNMDVYVKAREINKSKCFGDEIGVEFYNYPNKDVGNDSSIVANLKLNNVGYLFLGDATASVLNELVSEGVTCDVITAAHHGSKYSVSEDLMKKCLPRIGLISVGKNNYGHPSKDLIDLYNKYGVQYYRTDNDGTVMLSL